MSSFFSWVRQRNLIDLRMLMSDLSNSDPVHSATSAQASTAPRVARRRPPQRWSDLAASARLPNLPTVWSNLIASWFLANYVLVEAFQRWDAILVLLPVGTLLYLVGTFGNDWADSRWDARHKPNRAIPSGRMPRSLPGFFALFCLGAALLLAQVVSPAFLVVTVVLAATIALYTVFHKRGWWAVLLMGLARFLLPVLSFVACGLGEEEVRSWSWLGNLLWDHPIMVVGLFFAHPIALYLWTVGLSLVARGESRGDESMFSRAIWLIVGAVLSLLLLHICIEVLKGNAEQVSGFEAMNWLRLALMSVPPLVLVSLWVIFAWVHHAKLRIFVPRMLAGFCLLDVLVLAVIAPSAAIICLLLFLLALALQRLAPAT